MNVCRTADTFGRRKTVHFLQLYSIYLALLLRLTRWRWSGLWSCQARSRGHYTYVLPGHCGPQIKQKVMEMGRRGYKMCWVYANTATYVFYPGYTENALPNSPHRRRTSEIQLLLLNSHLEINYTDCDYNYLWVLRDFIFIQQIIMIYNFNVYTVCTAGTFRSKSWFPSEKISYTRSIISSSHSLYSYKP